ncbi:MAG: NAD-dependent epimerase/dehydratase family protein, partial [Tardiphaga sp.]
DLARPEALTVPPVETIYCTVDVSLLAAALPTLASASLKRVVAFTSTSIVTKLDSEIEAERQLLQRLADGERDLIAYCERAGIGWTILRPTIIYAEGRDGNISRLARLIERLGFLPLAGRGRGLRQPVHAEDLAIGAVAAAASPLAANQTYALPGTEVISYREMVGRIFDGLQKPRRLISLPVSFWRLAFMLAKPFFPNANVAMGSRMDRDLVFDPEPAIRDFNWAPRKFLPKFARSQ